MTHALEGATGWDLAAFILPRPFVVRCSANAAPM